MLYLIPSMWFAVWPIFEVLFQHRDIIYFWGKILFLVFWVYWTINNFLKHIFFPPVITLSAEIASLQSTILATRKEMQAQMEKQEKTEKTQPEIKKE